MINNAMPDQAHERNTEVRDKLKFSSCWITCLWASLAVTFIGLIIFLPLYLTRTRNGSGQCKSVSLTKIFGGTGVLLNCNDTVEDCGNVKKTMGKGFIINCSIPIPSLFIIKDKNVTWAKYSSFATGFQAFFSYGRCLDNFSTKIAVPHASCKYGNGKLWPCLPYNISDCPSAHHINESFGLLNSTGLHHFKIPGDVLITGPDHKGKDDLSKTLIINSNDEVMCPIHCGTCYSEIVNSLSLLSGTSSFDLC